MIGIVLKNHRIIIPRLKSRQLLSQRIVRLYSDNKYKSLDEFNKNRREFQFGQVEDTFKYSEESGNNDLFKENMSSKSNSEAEKLSEVAKANKNSGSDSKGNFESDYQSSNMEDRFLFELIERWKATIYALLLITGAIGLHQIYMNYEYLRNKLTYRFVYGSIKSKAHSIDTPSRNRKTAKNLLSKFEESIDENAISDLKPSTEVAGVYAFGKFNGKKYPVRIRWFDNKILKDLVVNDECLVAVDDKGAAYRLFKGEEIPQKFDLNHSITNAAISDDFFYFLTKNGKVIYVPKDLKKYHGEKLEETRSWLFKKSEPYGEIKFPSLLNSGLEKGEKVKAFSIGKSHMLLLTNKGRVFTSLTSNEPSTFENKGQLGLPQFSPYNDPKEIPSNTAFELTLLNYSISVDKSGSKSLQRRIVTNIAAGKYHNIVSDSEGSIWAWGSNTSGQCGSSLNYKSDIKSVPNIVFNVDDLVSSYEHIMKKESSTWCIHDVFAGNNSSYVELFNQSQDSQNLNNNSALFSFGDGIKGQLGASRFMHISSKPHLVKATLDLLEYDETAKANKAIGIKDVSVGGNHVILTLDNSGGKNDVLAFGDNEVGQLGNGNTSKSDKPIHLPKLLEPSDFKEGSQEEKSSLVKNVKDTSRGRLSLENSLTMNSTRLRQIITCGENTSAIYYKKA